MTPLRADVSVCSVGLGWLEREARKGTRKRGRPPNKKGRSERLCPISIACGPSKQRRKVPVRRAFSV